MTFWMQHAPHELSHREGYFNIWGKISVLHKQAKRHLARYDKSQYAGSRAEEFNHVFGRHCQRLAERLEEWHQKYNTDEISFKDFRKLERHANEYYRLSHHSLTLEHQLQDLNKQLAETKARTERYNDKLIAIKTGRPIGESK